MMVRDILIAGETVVAPGVYDGLSARIAQEAGFTSVYVSGGAIARSAGLPDLGLLSMTEVRDRVRQICESVDVAVIADIDTGYGNALNVYRTVREFRGLGVSGLQIEDQVTPKKCGHYDGKELISPSEMLGKIGAAREALTGSTVSLIVRTDAIAVEGFGAAMKRAKEYADAGADVLFVEAPESIEQVRQVAEELDEYPLLINMFEGGRTPMIPMPDLRKWGYRIVIVPSDLQRAAMRAMQDVAAVIRRDGDSTAVADLLASFTDRDALVRKTEWDERERRATSVPSWRPRR